MIDPRTDGISHINVYSRGRTPLGRALSNFANTAFTCEDGEFQSIEGYWYWLSCPDDRLRKLHGIEAKRLGRKLKRSFLDLNVFQEKIKKALRCKIDQHDTLKKALKESTLTFEHYYVYEERVIFPKGGAWILEELEKIRKEVKTTFLF